MNLYNYFIFAAVAGAATRTTELSIFQINDFRPVAFQSGMKSVSWDIAALLGCISMTAVLIHGFIKHGIAISIAGVVLFYFGYRAGLQLTRFGLISPILNILLVFMTVKNLVTYHNN
jgi:uncharacterized sodium:solute symporter family permease YidK